MVPGAWLVLDWYQIVRRLLFISLYSFALIKIHNIQDEVRRTNLHYPELSLT